MKTEQLFEQYRFGLSETSIKQKVEQIIQESKTLKSTENLKTIFSLIDLTTLDVTDTAEKAKRFADNVNRFAKEYPQYPNVAAICVYPSLIGDVKENLTIPGFNIASVTGGFPASQTFIEIKTAETKAAEKAGATEADMVISVGKFISEDYDTVFDEIKQIKKACGKMHLKVIMETGALQSYEAIKKACILSIEAGGDFLKTSTGKTEPAATPEAMYIMAQSVKEYYERTGKKIGLKPAGGISDSDSALIYFAIVKEVLGEEWLKPELFRIGASSLANKILSDLEGREVKFF